MFSLAPRWRKFAPLGGGSDLDFIVTSTHGRTGLKHALIGSVAEHVVRYAERPVLVVPSRHTES
jgi:nucleotide-binding universal stress UspA family protein